MEITTELVKELRNKTGISVMQCRKALEEASGDMEKALAILKKNSSDIALKKANRNAIDGALAVKQNEEKAVLLALHCETDFVSRNEDFVSLLSALADVALEEGLEAVKNKAKEMIDPIIQKTGEKIELGEVFEISGNVLDSYVHNSKSAAIVSLEGGNKELARDVAMHIVAMKPEYLSAEEISVESRKTVEEIFQKEVATIDKPEEIKQKMLEGKINTYFKEKTLLEQPFIKNGDLSVGQLLKNNGATIKQVARYTI